MIGEEGQSGTATVRSATSSGTPARASSRLALKAGGQSSQAKVSAVYNYFGNPNQKVRVVQVFEGGPPQLNVFFLSGGEGKVIFADELDTRRHCDPSKRKRSPKNNTKSCATWSGRNAKASGKFWFVFLFVSSCFFSIFPDSSSSLFLSFHNFFYVHVLMYVGFRVHYLDVYNAVHPNECRRDLH